MITRTEWTSVSRDHFGLQMVQVQEPTQLPLSLYISAIELRHLRFPSISYGGFMNLEENMCWRKMKRGYQHQNLIEGPSTYSTRT